MRSSLSPAQWDRVERLARECGVSSQFIVARIFPDRCDEDNTSAWAYSEAATEVGVSVPPARSTKSPAVGRARQRFRSTRRPALKLPG